MPFVRTKADAELVVRECPFKCQSPKEAEGFGWEVLPIERNPQFYYARCCEWLRTFIAGMYAERDRAEKELRAMTTKGERHG